MILEQVLTRDLGCAAYVVGCDHVHEAIVVDPPLHVEPVLEVCRRHGLRLVGVIETHTHADHVAGHGVLASTLGTWVATHPLGEPAYPTRPIVDGDRITLGHVALDILHTPGHRPEHCCVAVSDLERADEPWVLLTGDSLFVGDIARPDLAVAGAEGAEGLYRSLHHRLAGIADGVEVFPGHVAGSLCGRAMSARTSTTLGFERHHNRMLAEMAPAEFVRLANENLAQKPPTMARVVELNRGPLLAREPAARRLDALPANAQVLDVRPAAAVAA
ncbi:MAG: MBL fold metallo-hydrolase, partial [Gaiellales bacterium]